MSTQAMVEGPVLGAGTECSEQYLKTVEVANLGYDSSTQVGTGTSQGKLTGTSQGKPTYDDITRDASLECPPSGAERCSLDLDGLNSFRVSLERPLQLAHSALEHTDKDLCEALVRILNQVAELIETTATVVKVHRVLAQRILTDVLPRSKLATHEGDPNIEASHMTVVQMVIIKMQKDATLVRGSYLNILEAVQYLVTCTQLAIDFYDDVNDLGWAPSTLRSALHELRNVQNILADPSDFWLTFHVTELQLRHIENTIQQFLKVKSGARSNVWHSLEQLCLQYLMPQTQWLG